jgi:hypothetical protein
LFIGSDRKADSGSPHDTWRGGTEVLRLSRAGDDAVHVV